jgi:hypothetical protein
MSKKELTAITPEIDCDQTAMGLSPVTSAIFLQRPTFHQNVYNEKNYSGGKW